MVSANDRLHVTDALFRLFYTLPGGDGWKISKEEPVPPLLNQVLYDTKLQLRGIDVTEVIDDIIGPRWRPNSLYKITRFIDNAPEPTGNVLSHEGYNLLKHMLPGGALEDITDLVRYVLRGVVKFTPGKQKEDLEELASVLAAIDKPTPKQGDKLAVFDEHGEALSWSDLEPDNKPDYKLLLMKYIKHVSSLGTDHIRFNDLSQSKANFLPREVEILDTLAKQVHLEEG